MTYTQAKLYREALYQAHDAAADHLYAVSGGDKGPMGLTPDSVKETTEWKSAFAKERAAWDRLREHNAFMVKTFKKRCAKIAATNPLTAKTRKRTLT